MTNPTASPVRRRGRVVVAVSLVWVVGLVAVLFAVRERQSREQPRARDEIDVVGAGDGPVLVQPGEVVVLRAHGELSRVDAAGKVVAELPPLPNSFGEPDAIAVDPRGAVVLVSGVASDDDDPSSCVGTTVRLLPDQTWRRFADGASIALSADGLRLAYFRYATVDGFCRRAALVVRDLAGGTDSVLMTLPDGPLHGTPPEWPVNWSPNGESIAHVVDDGVVVTDVTTGSTTPASSQAGERTLAPGWLPDGTLVVLDGCCVGDATVRRADSGAEVFSVPGPVRSIRRGRNGSATWVTVEEGPFLRWDDGTLREIEVDALLSSG